MFEDFTDARSRVTRIHAVHEWLDTMHVYLGGRLGSRVGAIVRNASGVPRASRGRSWSFDVRRDDDTTLTFWLSYRPGSWDGYPKCGVLINGEDSGYRPEPSIDPLMTDGRGVLDYFNLWSVQYAA